MNSETIMKSDVLDILFENRNKEYGAYTLRKFYDNRMVTSLSIMMGAVIILSAFSFMPKGKTNHQNGNLETVMSYIKPDEKKPEPEKPKEPPKEKPAPQKIFTSNPVVVPNDKVKDTINTILPTDNIGTTNITGTGPVIIHPIEPIEPGTGTVIPVVDVNIPLTENEVEVMPSFPGGIPAFRKFLERNLTNPREMEEGEQISVQVKFVVGYDGKIKDISVIKEGGDEFDREVVRVVKKMPDWIPGKARGKNVSVYYTIPVKFIPAD